jgi:hypothetical protein
MMCVCVSQRRTQAPPIFLKSHVTERWEPSCPFSPFCEGALQKGVVPPRFEEGIFHTVWRPFLKNTDKRVARNLCIAEDKPRLGAAKASHQGFF